MKPCVTRAGLKLGPPCVISLEYNSPARGARKKASAITTTGTHTIRYPTHLRFMLTLEASERDVEEAGAGW